MTDLTDLTDQRHQNERAHARSKTRANLHCVSFEQHRCDFCVYALIPQICPSQREDVFWLPKVIK